MGSESTLPYLSPELTGQKLLVGANFASAGIGILNDTGIQFVSERSPIYDFSIIPCSCLLGYFSIFFYIRSLFNFLVGKSIIDCLPYLV